MWVILLEIGLALVLVVAIGWLTLPPKQDRDDQPPSG
jgi:hypothetical protein